jgi:Flavodoxin
MRAVVVYESMFGSTRTVAEQVAAGLRTAVDQVDVLRVCDADVATVMAADLLVVGGPTHAHGMSRRRTRQAAANEPTRYNGKGVLEPGAEGIGLREWFRGLPPLSGPAACFDTRADAPAMVTGRASRGIARCLRRAGVALVDQPRSFVVDKAGALKAGETYRAQMWGKALASSSTRSPAR